VTTVYVAASATIAAWAADVGLSKHVYKLGLADGKAKEIADALNEDAFGGVTDWKVIASREGDSAEEAAMYDRLAKREKAIDPTYYPKIKGARGLFRVKIGNVENSILVARALAGEERLEVKMKPADIGTYLINNALG